MTEEFDKVFGLDIPIDVARARFVLGTREENESVQSRLDVTDGDLEFVPFRKAKIRRVCRDGEWWYSVVDVIAAILDSVNPNKSWSDVRRQLVRKEGLSSIVEEIGELPLRSEDGKTHRTDVATTETLFRIIQSIQSPRAEPFKRWLARVGYERIQEAQDPEILIKRAILHYQVQGRSDDWIEKRIRSIVARKELTNQWKKRGISEGVEYAMLTNVISEGTFGMHTAGHQRVKGLKKNHNLRDHMTDLELILTMLGETSTREIAVQKDAQGFYENHLAATSGGQIAGSARKQIEEKTGKRVVSSSNFLGAGRRVADPQSLTNKG